MKPLFWPKSFRTHFVLCIKLDNMLFKTFIYKIFNSV
jgi:hypothetical protein